MWRTTCAAPCTHGSSSHATSNDTTAKPNVPACLLVHSMSRKACLAHGFTIAMPCTCPLHPSSTAQRHAASYTAVHLQWWCEHVPQLGKKLRRRALPFDATLMGKDGPELAAQFLEWFILQGHEGYNVSGLQPAGPIEPISQCDGSTRPTVTRSCFCVLNSTRQPEVLCLSETWAAGT